MIERRSWVFGLVVAAFIASATPTASLAQSVPALERTAGACTSCAPDGWTISTPSPDVIVGNGPWPGGTWVVSDLAGGPREGSTLLMTLAGGSIREAVTATITGLTPGGSYELSVYYQGATLSSSAGTYVNGDFRVTVAGTTADFPTSTGDAWSEAVVPFTASGTTASVILSIRDLGTGTFGGFVAADDISVRSTVPDADGDGDPDATDCAPGDPTIFTGAPEVADDGVDQDCNGADTITCFVDADMDGFGTVAGTTTLAADGSCDTADMEATTATDCDDMAAATFPGAPETPDDGVDQDCSGADTITCFVDADMDGFGTVAGTTTLAADGSCDTADMEATTATDCDDMTAATFPGAPETPDDGVDQDCSGADTITCFVDADMDGFGTVAGTTTLAADGSCDTADMEATTATDCDDMTAATFPGAPETPDDGVDQDCNGADTITCFVDADMDGFGTVAGTTTLAADGSCDTADMESSDSTDCDDMTAATFPGASETPDDGVDQDCNGADTITCFVDADMDGFGTATGTTTLAADGSCDTAEMESSESTDCDDMAAATFPGASETPDDGVDQDCSGADTLTCFVDADMDGFGTDEGTTTLAADGSCDAEDMESSDSTDCDDTAATTFPGATDPPDDGVDQDCSGDDAVTCFVDADMDGFGTDEGTTTVADDGSCDVEDMESSDSTDCDDTSDTVFPSAPELPGDGVDQDCDGMDLPVDGGLAGDGGVAASDGGDGGSGTPGVSGGACSCRVGASSTPRTSLGWLLFAAALVAGRLRRRRASAR